MKQSVRYVQIKLVINHDENVDPNDIINECEYSFQKSGSYRLPSKSPTRHPSEEKRGTISETELQEISETI
jgi:hypothetical protein